MAEDIYLLPQSDLIVGTWQLLGSGTAAYDRLNDVENKPSTSTVSQTPDTTTYIKGRLGNLTLGIKFNATLSNKTVVSAKLRFYAKTDQAADLHVYVNDSSTLLADVPLQINSFAYQWYEVDLPSTNPTTGDAWTLDEIKALQIYFNAQLISDADCYCYISTVELLTSLEEILVAEITSITPFVAKRGAAVTIVGTSLGNSTSATIAIGGANVTSFTTYTDTSIVFNVPDAATLGLQDVELIHATSTDIAVTDGIYIASTDAFVKANLKLGRMSRLYIGGQHVGFLEGNVELNPATSTFKFKSNDSMNTQKTWIIDQAFTLKFTLSEVNASTIAKVMNGTYDENSKTISFTDEPEIVDYEVAFVDASGVLYFMPVCNILEQSNLVLQATQNQSFPVSMECLPDANGLVAKIIFP